jgi:hypothetical protein
MKIPVCCVICTNFLLHVQVLVPVLVSSCTSFDGKPGLVGHCPRGRHAGNLYCRKYIRVVHYVVVTLLFIYFLLVECAFSSGKNHLAFALEF